MSEKAQLHNPSWIADRRFTDSLKWSGFSKSGVLPMWVADMDFRSAEPIIEALRKRVEEGVFGYAEESHEASEAVVQWLANRHNRHVQPDWIVWMPGVVPGIHAICRAFSRPGEGVFTFTPIYPPFLWSPQTYGRRTVTCPLTNINGYYQIDWQAFEASLTADTRIVLLCSPHNPVGRVWTVDELTRMAQICQKRNILLCSDEIHADLLLDQTMRHIPTASLPEEISKNCITLMSAAKTFNVPGLHCGYAIIPDSAMRKQFKETTHGIVPNVNIFGYTATLAAYTQGEIWLENILMYLRQNHDLLFKEINAIPGLSMGKVQATYLAWIDCRKLKIANPQALFERAKVGLMDGAAFGQEGFVRLNFACSREHLSLAIERIRKAVREHGEPL